MPVLRVPVNKKVIDWAITNGEKSEAALSKKYALDSWRNPQNDHDNPTFKQIQNFSRDTRIPFNYFFENELPKEKNEFVKFRTINNKDVQPSRRLIDTIYTMESRQEWMKQYLLAQDERTKFRYQHVVQDTMDPAAVAKTVSKLISLNNMTERADTDEDFFNGLRTKISSLGIMVMQNGVVGTNTQRPLEISEFRAFLLIDEVVPLIFINSRDSKKAKIFSLIHELVHALLGQSEILNVSPEMDLANERWINQVTINVLMPVDDVKQVIQPQRSPEENIKRLAHKFHVSLVATAIQTSELKIYKPHFIDWATKEQQLNLKLKTKSSGGDFYNTAISRVDKHFANAVINNESSGELAIAQAATMLGVTLKTYAAMAQRILGMA